MKADAVIISDPGVVAIARELTLKEIREVKDKSGVDGRPSCMVRYVWPI